MYRIIDCLTMQHDYALVAIAVMVCVIGSCLSAHLAVRLTRVPEKRRALQVALTSLLAGTTIWSTHFVAMLAYDPGYEQAYEPVMTVISFLVAVFGMAIAATLQAFVRKRPFDLAPGVVFGLTVSMMHYIGMGAYQFSGVLVWHPGMIATSILLGIGLGLFAFHRISRPVTRYCWMGGALFFVLAIASMHFTGMAAFDVVLSPAIASPEQAWTNTALGLTVTAVTGIIFLIGFISIVMEGNLEQEARDQIIFAGLHDPLTGLPNRISLSQRLAELTELMERITTTKVAILTIDLNRFKEVNDLHGHATGDQVLKVICTRMMEQLHEDEHLFRTGGDEFVAVKTGFHRTDQIRAFGDRLKSPIIAPIEIGQLVLSVGAAIGAATTLADGRDIDDLLHKSDLAMYRAKVNAEDRTALYDIAMDRQNQDRLQLIHDMHHAIERDEFELNYQLQNDTRSLHPVGFEALIRWNHPERGRVSPADFIPLAEETGAILKIGMWVMRTACIEATTWSKPYSIAVNVAPQQLVHHAFLEEVMDILFETGLPADRLELEITEASIIDDQEMVLKIMYRLKSMGIRIAMDDFGTGYSSLATLQAFPFDKIKIDRSFVQDVHENQQSAAIVRSTLLLGEALNIPVLAEGVETESELGFLRSENCASVQGFFFGTPMTARQLRTILDGMDVKTG